MKRMGCLLVAVDAMTSKRPDRLGAYGGTEMVTIVVPSGEVVTTIVTGWIIGVFTPFHSCRWHREFRSC